MTASVIVPARDSAEMLPALLRSLETQSLPRAQFEVIVIDNGSSDRTAEVARSAGATVYEEPKPGRALARNLGCSRARGGLFAFIDADCVADPGWLEALIRCLEDAPLAAGPVDVSTREAPTRLEQLDALWRFKEQEGMVKDEGWSVTANLGMRREAFEAIGGFDPSFVHTGEDLDLCARAKAAGFPITWCPDARVVHPAEWSLRSFARRAFDYGYAVEQMARVHDTGGGGQWRHPGPLLRGDWALRRFDVEPAALPAASRRSLLRLARLEYGGRMAGSAWAGVRLGPSGGRGSGRSAAESSR